MYDAQFLADLTAALESWQTRTLEPSLRERPALRDEFRTGSDEFESQTLYTPLDVAGIDYLEDIGFPAQYPFTRGVDPAGYRNRPWPRYFYTGYGSSLDARQRFVDLLASGADHLSIAFDLPTQLGYDSDHPMARGEVGKAGVALDSLADLERLFDGISLDGIGLGTVGNSIGPWALAMFIALFEKKGIDPTRARVTLQNDPFKEYLGRGTQIFPVRPAVDLASDAVAYACEHLPRTHPQYACPTTVRWGGGNATQEVAFGIANLMAYVEAARLKGVPPAVLVPREDLHMAADNDLIEEVAKFRATRRLWARLARERFATDDPAVLALRITVFTNATRMTAQQPLNNIVRTTIHVLACILGGVSRVSVPAYDEALALPTFESTWLANTIKHILTEESMVGNTVDPLAGGYYLETLTNQIEEKARALYEDIEAMGGPVAAIEYGYYRREMTDGAVGYQRDIESGRRTVVGVNKFLLNDEPRIELFQHNPESETIQLALLRDVRAQRDQAAVTRSLASIRAVVEAKATGQGVNIMPAMLEAVRAYATIGEIFGVMRAALGEYVFDKGAF